MVLEEPDKKDLLVNQVGLVALEVPASLVVQVNLEMLELLDKLVIPFSF